MEVSFYFIFKTDTFSPVKSFSQYVYYCYLLQICALMGEEVKWLAFHREEGELIFQEITVCICTSPCRAVGTV